MKQLLRILGCAALCGLLTGCPSITLVKSGSITLQDRLTVETTHEWSLISGYTKWDVLTVDGARLQRIAVLGGLEDGESIFSFPQGQKAPKFKSSMTAVEIAEAIKSSMALGNLGNFKIINLRPYKIGSEDGFRFDCTYKTKDGLDFKCLFVGAVYKNRLSLIAAYGTAVYYYDNYSEEAERMIKSARFI